MNDLIAIQSNLTNLLHSKSNALPKDFNQMRFIQNCMQVLLETKNIENMHLESIARTMLKGAFLGLDFFMKECYAIPYGQELKFQTDYKGEIKIVKKYSIRPIIDICAKVVREGDVLDCGVKQGISYLDFQDNPFSKNKIIGAFAVCQFVDGGFLYEVMSSDEIEFIKNKYSKQPNGDAWKNTVEMYKKTVIRRLRKSIQIDFESLEQAKTYDESSDFEMPKMVDITEPKAETQQVIENITEKVEAKISDAQLKRLLAIQTENKVTDDMLKPCISNYGYTSRKLILKKDYDAIIVDIEAMGEMLRVK